MCMCWVGMNGEKCCKCDDTDVIDPRVERHKTNDQSPETSEAVVRLNNLLKRKLLLATEALEKMAETMPVSHGMGLVTYGHKAKQLASETLQKMEAL